MPRRRLPRNCWWLFAIAACALPGCREAPLRPEMQPAQIPPHPAPADYPSLCADPDAEAIVGAYLRAWRGRTEAPDDFAKHRSRILDPYSAAYREIGASEAEADYDVRLRVLWDLCGLAHATMIPPELIKQAVEWQEPERPENVLSKPIAATDASHHPVRLPAGCLPGVACTLLESVTFDASQGLSFADFVSANARQVYLTPQLVEWSPSCPLDVCGSSEPLTRTVILVSASYIDLSPKPDWSLAAVAVHECAHIQWFHRDDVTEDPRLLLPVPNERNAWRIMAQFLRGLADISSPTERQYVREHAGAIRKELSRAEEQVRRANTALGLSEDDESERVELPAGISESDLRGGLTCHSQTPTPTP